jgi:hypothetical protein
MAGSSAPAWKQLFDAAERTIGTRVNDFARSENYAILVGLVARVRTELADRNERTSRQVLHLFNLPAGSDVNRLLGQIAKLEREVRELRKQLDGATTGRKVASNGASRQPRRRARQDSA